MEAYCSALCQLRALLHLAQRLINDNDYGQLYSLHDRELSHKFVQEYSSMHKACFYGRCLGFQVNEEKSYFTLVLLVSLKFNVHFRFWPHVVCVFPQFSPALRPFLQTVVISMVSYGETYGKQQSGLGMSVFFSLTSLVLIWPFQAS